MRLFFQYLNLTLGLVNVALWAFAGAPLFLLLAGLFAVSIYVLTTVLDSKLEDLKLENVKQTKVEKTKE